MADRGSNRARQRLRSSVLLARRDIALSERLARYLARSGFRVETVGGGHDLVHRLEEGTEVDAVVIELPEQRSAVELTERVRRADDEVAMIAVLDSAGETLRAAVLEAGADDVVDMPLTPIELSARLRAVLRRTNAQRATTELVYSDLQLDTITRRGRRGDDEFTLTRTEYDLLELLLEGPERVLSRSFIFEQVWGYDIEFSSNSLDVYVAALRRKTEAGGRARVIQTVRGVGFELREV
jgi:two-component system, OmpR family, response regulator MprA